MTEETHDADYERINKNILDIFNKAAQERPKNPTMVGSPKSFSTYEPHNHRLYFSYSKPTPTDPQPMSRGRFSFSGSKNYGKELSFEDTETKSKITIKKSLVELRYKGRSWFLIDNSKPEEIEEVIKAKRKEAIDLFKEFISLYNLKSNCEIVKEYVLDNGIKDNTLTEKQPVKSFYETEVVKKLYGEKKLEFKSIIAAKNHAHNSGLYDFSPEIAQRLDLLTQSFTAIEKFTEQINLHLEVESRTNELLKTFLDRQGNVEERKPSIIPPLFSSSSSSTPDANKIKYSDSWYDNSIFPRGWFDR